LATRNPGKIKELRAVLADLPLSVVGLEAFGEIPEPEENGATFAENARDKALYYAQATGQWCLADDSGLVVDAIGGLPGVQSARYATDDVPPDSPRAVIDKANNRKLLRALAQVPDPRTARFVCHLALAEPGRVLLEAFDAIEGRIINEEHGDNGFGYDPLFWVDEKGCTTAELPSADKNQISHRGKALKTFSARLHEMLRGLI